MSLPPRTRRRKRTRRQARNPSIEVVEVENLPNIIGQESTCIDLTRADDDIEVTRSVQPVVDLTNVIDSPIVIGTPDSPPVQRQRTRWPSSSDSDSSLLEVAPFHIPDTPARSAEASTTSTEDAEGGGAPAASRAVVCPVCLDTSEEICSSGRQLSSTTCGHVFCNECINDSIKSQKRCPSCRKKLTQRQVHPLFI